MKVLEPGNGQKGYWIEIVCTGNGNRGGGCGAKLLVEQDDMRRHTSYDYSDYVLFNCSECGVATDIPYSQWPPNYSDLKKMENSFSAACAN